LIETAKNKYVFKELAEKTTIKSGNLPQSKMVKTDCEK
jgi:hypothetical protein